MYQCLGAEENLFSWQNLSSRNLLLIMSWCNSQGLGERLGRKESTEIHKEKDQLCSCWVCSYKPSSSWLRPATFILLAHILTWKKKKFCFKKMFDCSSISRLIHWLSGCVTSFLTHPLSHQSLSELTQQTEVHKEKNSLLIGTIKDWEWGLEANSWQITFFSRKSD